MWNIYRLFILKKPLITYVSKDSKDSYIDFRFALNYNPVFDSWVYKKGRKVPV